jgi:hypothetical protein
MLKLMEEGSKLLSDLLGRANGNGGPYSMASETSEAIKLFAEIAQHWRRIPARSPRLRAHSCATTYS